jgi:hypothetical protein
VFRRRRLSVDRIKHDYALTQNDAIDRLLPSIARRSGFRAKKVKHMRLH